MKIWQGVWKQCCPGMIFHTRFSRAGVCSSYFIPSDGFLCEVTTPLEFVTFISSFHYHVQCPQMPHRVLQTVSHCFCLNVHNSSFYSQATFAQFPLGEYSSFTSHYMHVYLCTPSYTTQRAGSVQHLKRLQST